jgi:hypothetical protein
MEFILDGLLCGFGESHGNEKISGRMFYDFDKEIDKL